MSVESIARIDVMAFAGYDYAVSGGSTPIPEFFAEINLLAFNAGISNANIRQGLSVKPIGWTTTVSHAGRQRASDKELQTIWGGN